VDSQSLKTTGVGGKERDYEAAKKVKGRKRHLLVDTQGLLIRARLHSAQIQEREGIKLLLDIAARDRLPQRLSHLWLAPDTPENRRARWVQEDTGLRRKTPTLPTTRLATQVLGARRMTDVAKIRAVAWPTWRTR